MSIQNIRNPGLSIILISIVAALSAAGCTATVETGTIRGAVTIGPVFAGPASPNDTRPVPNEVFSARKIIIYDSAGKKVIETVRITQVGQSASGHYVAQLEPGTYIVDIADNGIDHADGLPKRVTVAAGQTTIVDMDIDTGIR
jgi:hypothetical protein